MFFYSFTFCPCEQDLQDSNNDDFFYFYYNVTVTNAFDNSEFFFCGQSTVTLLMLQTF